MTVSRSQARGATGPFAGSFFSDLPQKLVPKAAKPAPAVPHLPKSPKVSPPSTPVPGHPAKLPPAAVPVPQPGAEPDMSPETSRLWRELMERTGPPSVDRFGGLKRANDLSRPPLASAAVTPKPAPFKPQGSLSIPKAATDPSGSGLPHPSHPMRHAAASNPYINHRLTYDPVYNAEYPRPQIQGMPASAWDTSRLPGPLRFLVDAGYSYFTPKYTPALSGMSPFGTQVTSYANPIFSNMAGEVDNTLRNYRPVFSSPETGDGAMGLLQEILQLGRTR